MSHTDPIADLLTRIRNANRAGLSSVNIPHSIMKESVVRVIADEGFLSTIDVVGQGRTKHLIVGLKYTADRRPVMTDVQRVSRPGRRVYVGHEDIEQVRRGLGISVLSTPKGIMTDSTARKSKLGGELLCTVC